MRSTKMDRLPRQGPQIFVAARPVIRGAVIGIAITLHADLVPIVNRRNAGIRHLPEESQRHAGPPHGRRFPRQSVGAPFPLRHLIRRGSFSQDSEKPLHVVASQEIHRRVEIVRRIILLQGG